jgi:hypothetical protein
MCLRMCAWVRKGRWGRRDGRKKSAVQIFVRVVSGRGLFCL